jgi:NAD(P)H-dependent flavin oxidoreductase YrpB (nitropropane dioxygenase family)
MGKLKTVGYELRDVAVMQAPVSFCNHRGDVNPFIEVCDREVYPIFVAPMASVTDQNNYKIWIDNKLTPVVPRSVQKSENNPNGLTFDERMEIAKETFISVSLKEAQNELREYLAKQLNLNSATFYICIDIAHGTLSELYDVCKLLKSLYGQQIIIMTGNVANPSAYSFYADAGVDYCRVGIGGGSRCTSSANVSIHYGMATLLDQINEERKAYAHSHNGNAPTKIIADGGIGWFDDIQKALALGADAVMAGKIFAECEEACEPIYYSMCFNTATEIKIYPKTENEIEHWTSDGYKKFRDYYGMSSRRAQKITGGDGNKTSEGIDRPVEVKYPVAKWVDNMQSYLRSCMTYTNSHTIKELRENAQVIILGGSGDAAYRK